MLPCSASDDADAVVVCDGSSGADTSVLFGLMKDPAVMSAYVSESFSIPASTIGVAASVTIAAISGEIFAPSPGTTAFNVPAATPAPVPIAEGTMPATLSNKFPAASVTPETKLLSSPVQESTLCW